MALPRMAYALGTWLGIAAFAVPVACVLASLFAATVYLLRRLLW